MPVLIEKSRILLSIENPEVLEKIRVSLQDESDFSFIEQPYEGIQPAIAKAQPNLVLIDFDSIKADIFKSLDNISTHFPEVAVVVIFHASEAKLSDGMILSGARAVLQFPFSKEELLDTLRRAVEITNRNLTGSPSHEKDLQEGRLSIFHRILQGDENRTDSTSQDLSIPTPTTREPADPTSTFQVLSVPEPISNGLNAPILNSQEINVFHSNKQGSNDPPSISEASVVPLSASQDLNTRLPRSQDIDVPSSTSQNSSISGLSTQNMNASRSTSPDVSAHPPVNPIPAGPKNMFTIFSPKGGTGCTTVAINLAIALRKLINEPVLLMDGKPMFGDIALMLNIRTNNSITDLISHAGMLDKQLINQVAVGHVSGIKVLPGPVGAMEAQGIRAEDLYKVITELQATFPAIIVDGGNYLHENTVTYMDASDKIIVVLNPNLASIRAVRQFIDICKMLSYPDEKIILVVNNSGHKTDIHPAQIEKIFKQKITCDIHSDDNLFRSSLNEGVPALIKKPHHPAIKAMQKLAMEISNEIVKKNTR